MNHQQTLERLNVRFLDTAEESADGIGECVFNLRDVMRVYRASDEIWAVRQIHPRHILDRSPEQTDMNFIFVTEQGIYDLMARLASVETVLEDVKESAKALREAVRGICDEYAEDFAGSYTPALFPIQAKHLGLI